MNFVNFFSLTHFQNNSLYTDYRYVYVAKKIIIFCNLKLSKFLNYPLKAEFYRCLLSTRNMNYVIIIVLPRLQKNIRFDFDDELKIGDVRYDKMT